MTTVSKADQDAGQSLHRADDDSVSQVLQPEALKRSVIQSRSLRQKVRDWAGADSVHLAQDRWRGEELIATEQGMTTQMNQRELPESQTAGEEHQSNLPGGRENQGAFNIGLG